MKIKKGDNVKMLGGKDRGKTGKVLTVFPKESKVMVEGLNLLTKHRRAKQQGQKGETIKFPRAIPSSRVALMCPQCGKATRVGFVRSAEGVRSRRCTDCQATFA